MTLEEDDGGKKWRIVDAMIIIQEASAKIAQVSDKLSGLETNNQEVVAALKDLSNKVANLENGRDPTENRIKLTKVLCIHV